MGNEFEKAYERLKKQALIDLQRTRDAAAKASAPRETVISRSREESKLVENLYAQLSQKHYGSLARLLGDYGDVIGELVGTEPLTPQLLDQLAQNFTQGFYPKYQAALAVMHDTDAFAAAMEEVKASLAPAVKQIGEIHGALSLLMDGEKMLLDNTPLSPSDKGAFKMSRLLDRDINNLRSHLDTPCVTLTVKSGGTHPRKS